nr:MFS transporter [Thermoanaerobaculia bacterium]
MERTRAAPLASPMGRARSLIGVLVSVGVVGLGWGTLMPLIPVLLQREGVSEGWIGVNSAMPTLAVLTVGAAMGALLGRLGLARALFGSLGLIVVAILALHLFRDFWSSVLLRYVIGLGAGLHWILSETWVNSIAPPHRRGLVVGLYSTIYMSGFTIGPAALSQLDLDGPWSFLLIAGTTAVAGIALWLVRRDLPHVDPERATPSWEVLATGKPVFLAALGSGLIDSAA